MMSKEKFIKSLEKIGTKLSDFEEIPNEKKNLKYTILGRGFFGYVEKMKSKKNNLFYAIKKLRYNVKDKNFKRETEILFDLNHENIVKFYGYFEDKENITKYKQVYYDKLNIKNEASDINIYCLVLEYVPNGSLNDYYNIKKPKLKTNPIKESFIIQILKQILQALIYLFDKSVMHRDIKPDNILFDENNKIKIGDFGLAALYKDKNPENKNKHYDLFGENTVCGRNDFIPPEIEKGQNYDFACDIFYLGLTMLILISTENPIIMPKDINLEKRKININFINPIYNKYLVNLVLLMINEDPMMRPTAKQAYDNLVQIENLINPKDANNKNTSLIRVLQLLCRCIKENFKLKIQGFINNSLSLELFNILEITTKKIANKSDKETFIQNVTNFRKKISSKSQFFKGEEEISPKRVFDELFRITKEDFMNNNIIWNSNVLNGLVESIYLPKASFPYIYEKIGKIKKECNNPFFDYFYYISIGFTQCPNCKISFQPDAHCFYFIPLPAINKDKISNLILNYFNNPKKIELKCDKCSQNRIIIHKFFTTPKYLLIFLDGKVKKEKLFDEYIDLSQFCYTNIGPKKYYLYGFIRESSTSKEYKSIIKNENENNWIFFSEVDSISKTGFNYNLFYSPNIVIYKGLD